MPQLQACSKNIQRYVFWGFFFCLPQTVQTNKTLSPGRGHVEPFHIRYQDSSCTWVPCGRQAWDEVGGSRRQTHLSFLQIIQQHFSPSTSTARWRFSHLSRSQPGRTILLHSQSSGQHQPHPKGPPTSQVRQEQGCPDLMPHMSLENLQIPK